MQALLTLVRTILTPIAGLVATLLFGTAAIVVGRINPASPWVDRIARAWSRMWLVAAGSRVHVQGGEHVERNRSYVVVANHQSDLDIMACFVAIPLPIRFLAKKELFKIPLLSSAMRAIGIVEVDRQAHAAIHARVNTQTRDLIARGRSVIIYAEGTRSRDGELHAFKKGAFTMAVGAQLPVLPVTIYGSRQAWEPDTPWVHGGPISVVIDRPIPTEGLVHDDVPALLEQTRAVIAGHFDRLRAAHR